MKYNSPLVSVIILNYNGGDSVKRCIRSVLNSKYPNIEVVVFDNASKDGSYEEILREFRALDNLKIIRSDVNYGFAKGNNVALNYAKGDYILFLNNDTEVDPYCIGELLKIAMKGFSGIIQCKLIFMHDKRTLESAGAYIDKCGYGYESLLIGHTVNNTRHENEIFYANGAAFMVSRCLVNDISLDDEFF
ncbi:MAG: glycosyltransferase [Nitrososphaeria archaeon]